MSGAPSVPVSADQALTADRAVNAPDAYTKPNPPTITLRTVSVGYEGQDTTFQPHLAWVITWTGGSAELHGQTSTPGDAYSCTYVDIVNATTEAVERGEYSFCRLKSSS